jgi:predicted dehydrogenase
MTTIGIGLVGYGGIGRLHALCVRQIPIVYPDLPPTRLAGVVTASERSAERARRELEGLFVTTRLDELLARPDMQIVDCCTPTAAHLTVGRAALAAGKALFCEKPLAATLAEARELVELARAHRLAAGLNFHFRQIPAIQEARRFVAHGGLGEVVGFHLRYYRASNLTADRPISWRFSGPGSGVLVDLGSHLIDLVEHLLGPIARVGAQTRTLIAERPDANGQLVAVESDDVVWLALELASGGRGTLEASKVVPGAADDLRVEAYGTRGTLVFDTRDVNSLYLADATGGRQLATFSRTDPPASLPGPEMPTGALQWHLASLAAFVAAFAAGESPSPSLEEGLRVQAVLEAALRAARLAPGNLLTIA